MKVLIYKILVYLASNWIKNSTEVHEFIALSLAQEIFLCSEDKWTFYGQICFIQNNDISLYFIYPIFSGSDSYIQILNLAIRYVNGTKMENEAEQFHMTFRQYH